MTNQILFSLSFLIFYSGLFAQGPAILVRAPGDTTSSPIQLKTLSIEGQVVGMLATTTMEMTFYNPHDRVLEGQLYVPLGPGQRMSRFALEIEGSMREGVVVEKARGRQVFESIVRQNIDPGLLEWSQGNVFKARIFPIPARGTKRIIIAYEQELPYEQEGLPYLIPLDFRDTVKQFDLRMEVIKQVRPPIPTDLPWSNFSFESWRDSWVAEQHLRNYLPNQHLSILIPHPETAQRILVEESTPDNRYFFANVPIQPILREKQRPSQICLLWDLSQSAKNRKLDRELELLDSYFQWVEKARVQLIGFHIEAQDLGTFQVRRGKWTDLKETLSKFSADGGTQLGCLDLSQYSCDEFLLFSDGLSTIGQSEVLPASSPIFPINSAKEADFSYLQYLAEMSGGQFIHLPSQTQADALSRLQSTAYQFLSASVLRGNATELYPSLPQAVNRSFSLVGKLGSDQAEIELRFGIGTTILSRKRVVINKTVHLGGGDKVSRIWAQKKLAELDRRYTKNEAEITQLGKEFGIVTRNTSLIVLDRIEDYVDNEVVPPKEMQAEYDALVQQRTEEKRLELMSQLDLVAEQFALRKSWWEKEFKIPKKKYKRDPVKKSVRELIDDSDADGVPDLSDAEESMAVEEDAFSLSDAMASPAPEPKPEDLPNPQATGTIILQVWNPETPYLKAIQAGERMKQYPIYLNQMKDYGKSPAFYLDVSDHFRQQGDSALALRILSNIAELELENHELLRILGHRLLQLGQHELAISVFQKVVELREEEPQSYRDLGHAYARNGQYQEAIESLYVVVTGKWDDRFRNIGALVAQELTSILGQCGCADELDLTFIDDRLLDRMPTDIRVVLNWDSDGVDMDLWVTDPRGEKCYYQHKRTEIGGFISDDFTGGYGPEEFWLRRAMPGTYQIEVNYYGSRRQSLSGPTTIQAELILDYGRPEQSRKEITIRLGKESEVIQVGEFTFD